MKGKFRKKRQPAGVKPQDYLKFAEQFAVRTRKLLATLDHSVPTGDAMLLLAWIENISKHGRGKSAVEARRLAGKVEVLVDAVRAEFTALS